MSLCAYPATRMLDHSSVARYCTLAATTMSWPNCAIKPLTSGILPGLYVCVSDPGSADDVAEPEAADAVEDEVDVAL